MKPWNTIEMAIQFKADGGGVRSLWYLAMINTVRYLQGDPANTLLPLLPRPAPDCSHSVL